jgi:hypothetical protein
MTDDNLFEEAENFFNNLNEKGKNTIKKNEKSQVSLKNNKENEIITNNNNSEDILLSYLNRLKSFGFPELGKITLSPITSEQEKTFQFFEHLIMKKANDSADYQKFRYQNDTLIKKCEALENQITKYEKEIRTLNDELRNNTKNKKDFDFKISKQKEVYEKQSISLKNQNIYLNNKMNKILLEKKNLEEKIIQMSENINKLNTVKTKMQNNSEMIDYVTNNNLSNMLSKVNGAEKLVETLKGGYNDSLRELLFEISALKNFIYDIHKEITLLIDYPVEINEDLLNLPFLDTVSSIKDIFNKNMNLLKAKIGLDNQDEINFDNLKTFTSLKIGNVSDLNNKNSKENNSIKNEDNDIDNKLSVENLQNINDNSNENQIEINEEDNKTKNLLNSFEKKLKSYMSKDDELKKEDENIKNEEEEEEDFLQASYGHELEEIKMKWAKAMLSSKEEDEENNNE